MKGCNLIGFDLEACAWSAAGGIGSLLPWPVWAMLGLIFVGIVWRVAGWQGLVGLAGLGGFLLGRRSAANDDNIWPPPDRSPRSRQPKHRPTILDWWRSR